MNLFDKYRPSSWCQVLGQDAALKKIEAIRPRSLSGRAWWINGQSGTGKTTIARLLAADVADDFFTLELDAGDLSVSKLKEIEAESNISAWGKGGRAYIVNEAHGLRKDAIRQLLVMLERIPSHVVYIFTTTCDGQDGLFEDKEDAGPLLSRCVRLDLARRDLAKLFAAKAMEIATKEGLNGKPEAAYLKLVQDKRNNFRAVLQSIESGEMCA